MALIKCPECGKEISDQAKACIFCGYPIPKVKPMTQNNEVGYDVKEQPNIVEISSNEPSVSLQMNEKQKKKIAIIAVAIILAILAIWGITTSIDNNTAKARDLSNVFDFSFDMTMEDVIAYEAKKYGNTEYERENLSDIVRLDFEKYSYDDWKHRYFFDKETGLLRSVFYSGVVITFGDKDDAECEHVRTLKRELLDEIGEWDEKPTDDSVRSVAYGQIDGVPCKILYFDGATQEIYISIAED